MIPRPRAAARLTALAAAGWVCLLVAGCGSGHVSSTGTVTKDSDTTTATTSTTTTLPGTGKPSVTLGDSNTTEQFILGELYDLALSAQGFSVTLTRNIGPPEVSYQALEQGNLNLYPEYLNVWNSQVVHQQHPPDCTYLSAPGCVARAFEVGQTWASEHQLELLEPTPGSNVTGIAVTAPYAQTNHLHSLEDLARLSPTLSLGAPLELTQNSTTLSDLETAYGLTPAKTYTVVIGDQYSDLLSGKIKAAFVQSTDAELSTRQFRFLSDPKHVNGFGNIVPVVTAATIAAQGPVFVQTLNRVDMLLTTRVLRRLNAEYQNDHMDPLNVAKQFLEQHGLLTASTAP